MLKYSPNENTYKEMYLINKFEKDVMESSLQNMRHDKTKSTQKIPTSNKTSSENEKEALETSNKKKSQSENGNENLVSNENDIEGSNLEFSIPVLKRKNFQMIKPRPLMKSRLHLRKELIETYPGIILY